MDKKKLLLLGGTRNMKEILDAAHKLDLAVGVTDWYDVKRSPVKLLAEESFDISILDEEKLDRMIREHHYDGVLTGFTDSYLIPYAEICSRNRLFCYGTREQFEILTNKAKYKELFNQYQVPTLETYDPGQIDERFAHFPILLKPAEGSGGNGLRVIADYEEFLAAQSELQLLADPAKIIIEPFLTQRREMTAFFLFVDGEVYLTGTANRFLSGTKDTKIGLPLLYSMPASDDQLFRQHTAPALMRLFRDLELKNGMLFAQCFLHEGVPKVYDLGYRLTGTQEYKLMEQMMGINPLEMMIHHALSGTMNPSGRVLALDQPAEGYGFNATILGRVGTIGSIAGEEAIRTLPGMLDLTLKSAVGDSITDKMVGTLGQIIARVFFTAPTLEAAAVTLQQVYDLLVITDTTGQDMIVERMDPARLLASYEN